MYITLHDCSPRRKHVFTQTGGGVTAEGNKTATKKLRRMFYNMQDIMLFFYKIFSMYNLKKFVFKFTTKFVRRDVKVMHKLIAEYGGEIVGYKYYFPVAHNGVRGQHIRYRKTHRRRRRKNKR